jgi:hypothetical protein
MLQSNDLVSVYEFVKATGEGNLRKMMTGPKMTAAHVGLLLKVVRASKSDEFVKYCETNAYPKMKFNDQETKIRDTFWATACDCFIQLGLASTAKVA